FTATATTGIYPLSLHDALPIYDQRRAQQAFVQHVALLEHGGDVAAGHAWRGRHAHGLVPLRVEAVAGARRDLEQSVGLGDPVQLDRKSTRLNSSHVKISYAVFC